MDVVLGVGQGAAQGGEGRAVAGERVACAARVRLQSNQRLFEYLGVVLQVVLPEEVGHVQLGRGARRHANGSPAEVIGARDAQLLRNHEALPVVEHGLNEVAPVGVPGCGPGGDEDQHVHFARLENGPALGGCNDADVDGVRVTQDRGRHGAAQVDVEPCCVARFVQEAEARRVRNGGADETAASSDRVQARTSGLLISRLGGGPVRVATLV